MELAQKRMFDKDIISSDNFIDLPAEAKALYFLLGMEADDEGFVSAKKVMRLYNIQSEDSIKLLIVKDFVIPFDSGVIVITDWKRNNYLRDTRIRKSIFVKEKNSIVYDNVLQKYQIASIEKSNQCISTDNTVRQLPYNGTTSAVQLPYNGTTDVQQMYGRCTASIEENSIEENSIVAHDKRTQNKSKMVIPPDIDDVRKYCIEKNNGIDAEYFYDYYSARGWMLGKTKMKDWKRAINTWIKNKNNRNSTFSNAQSEKSLDELLGGL